MFCQHISECGGCTSQHVPYPVQLQQKQATMERLFPAPLPIIPCQDPFRYRNKMEFSFSQNKAGDKFLGLVIRGSKGKVFNLQECLLSPAWFAEVVKRVKAWWEENDVAAFHFHRGEGTLRTLTLREGHYTGDRMAILTVSGNPRFGLTRPQLNGFIQAVGDMSIFLRIQQPIQGQPTQFYEMHLRGQDHIREEIHVQGRSLSFKISPSSFFQPNTRQAELMYTTALDIAGDSPLVYDLYCGAATIGMVFSFQSEKVVGVESNPYSVFDAQSSAEYNQISNLDLHCADVGTFLSHSTTTPHLVIVDPPRSGLDAAAISHLQRLSPRQILYISCHPAVQASNIEQLNCYRIVTVQPIDQFPHTPHIENIVLLRRMNF